MLWNAGHKEACRKLDQIEIGDIMRIKKVPPALLPAATEDQKKVLETKVFHGCVVGRDDSQQDHWMIKKV